MYKSNTLIRVLNACLIPMLFLIVFCTGCTDQTNSTVSPSLPTECDNISTYTKITDIKQRSVLLKTPVKKIVCLNTDQASMLAAIGAGDHIYGVTPSVLESAILRERLPNALSIGEGSSPDIERIISLKPDVVLVPTTSANSAQLADKFDRANVTFMNIDGFIVTQIPDEIRILGNLTGHTKESEHYLHFYNHYKNLIDSRLTSIPEDERLKVYIESNPEYCTYGRGSGGDSLVRMAFGTNIAGSMENYYPYISPEWLMERNPEVIIKVVSKNFYANTTIVGAFKKMMSRPSLSDTKAVKNRRAYILNNQVTYHTRGIIAQLYLAKIFYPEKFVDINPDDVLKEHADLFLPWPENEIPIYPCDWCKNETYSIQ